MKKRANYQEQTLENQVLVDVTEALQGINQLKSGIEGLKTLLDSFSKSNGMSNFNKETTSLGEAIKKTINFSAIYLSARQAFNTLKNMNEEAVNYTETVNLFNVSFGKGLDGLNQYYEKALDFQERLEEKLGVNIEESMRYQALFNSMSKSMGLSANYAYTLSENMTKLGYDLASLYNIDTESAMTKLRAGLAGQTEPLRELGLDITEQSLKPILQELNITDSDGELRSIRNMSQAEKTILRYIAVLKQATIAQGDFANTMDSPANQLRIFNAQVTAFKRNMGNLWQGFLGGILPYINAIMMVVNELLKMTAQLFGFEVSEQSVNISASIGADDLANDLGTASGKAKELKNQLMGFDEINNITLDKDSSSSSGDSSGVGIDQRLLDALDGYNNRMDEISNTAAGIRDKMLEWLGFKRNDDGTWKLKEGLTNFEKILDIAKLIGVAIGTWKISSTITNLFKNLGILKGKQNFQIAFGLTLALTGIYAQYKGTKHLLNGDIDLFTILETLLGTAGGTFGIASILKATKLGKTLGFKKSLMLGLGITMSIQSIQVLQNGIKENDLKQKLIGSLEAGLGVGLTVSSLSGNILAGLTVGVTVTALVGLASIIQSNNEYEDSMKKLSERILENKELVEESTKSWNDKKTSVQDTLNTELIEIENIERLTGELGNLVDSNGKVKEGYEDRVKFILNEVNDSFGTEYELVDGQISKNGELVDSYEEIKKSIADTIEAKKAEAIAEANQEMYTEAIKNQTKYYKERKDAIENNKVAEEELSKALEKVGLTMEDYTEDGQKMFSTYNAVISSASEEIRDEIQRTSNVYETTKDVLEKANKNWKESTEFIVAQENLKTAILTGDNEKIQEAIRQTTNTYETESGKQTLTLSEQIDKQAEIRKTSIDYIKSQNMELTDELKASLDSQLKNLGDNLVAQTSKIEELTPENIEAWKTLAEKAEEIYNEKILQVDSDTQLVLEAILGKVDINSEKYINKWTNLAETSRDRYNQALSKLDEDTAQEIRNAVGKIDEGKEEAGNKSEGLGSRIASKFINGLGDTKKTGENFVQGFLNVVKQDSPLGVLSSVFNLGSRIISSFNGGLKEHSPSKATEESAKYFIEGFTNEIGRSSSKPLTQIKNLGTEITDEFKNSININEVLKETRINPNKFKIDISQFVDYSTITGNINTQAKVETNNLPQQVKQAVIEGMSQVSIPVEIEAKTDEGVIFTKVQAKAREFVMQTGEEPFPSPT